MTIPPTQKTTQQDYIKSAVRFPPDVYAEIKIAAARNCHSMNAEILARLKVSRVDVKLEEIDRRSAKLESMLRQVLDKM